MRQVGNVSVYVDSSGIVFPVIDMRGDSGAHWFATGHAVNNISINLTPFKTMKVWYNFSISVSYENDDFWNGFKVDAWKTENKSKVPMFPDYNIIRNTWSHTQHSASGTLTGSVEDINEHVFLDFYVWLNNEYYMNRGQFIISRIDFLTS